MTDKEVRVAVEAAIKCTGAECPRLNFQAAHERSTAHRLAVHLEVHFSPDWNVDCEYDRDGQLRKSLVDIANCSSIKKTNDILPDIIVHHRLGEGREHNLLVIEVKKDNAMDVCDREKLQRLTDPQGHYAYQFGLYINVDGGKFTCTWYENGKPMNNLA